jgi:diketogulonate reductase-like aldo/keto reductase
LIRSALDAGYRHIDTAVAYDNHKMLGDALAEIFNEGKYKREDIFITTKVNPCKEWNALDIL